MKYLVVSPHDDDAALFIAFTCLRLKPDIAVVLDSYIQPKRGEVGCSVGERAEETERANEILGCPTIRLGLRDDTATEDDIGRSLQYLEGYDTVYIPALQGGNIHHDMIHRACRKVFKGEIIEYTTYTKTELWTKGETEVIPTQEELEIKTEALNCYKSQIRINRPHFDAVLGKNEWLNGYKLKKCFVLTQFGSPHKWTEQFLENVGKLGKYGWYWKIFTSNKYENVPDNVEIVPMTTDQFNDLVEDKLGVRPNMFMTQAEVPSVHVTDFYVFTGLIFEDYLKGFDFWGITNIDIVYGRLDRFISDKELEQYDVWTDDIKVINGIFCLFRNRPDINNLCKEIPFWKEKVGQKPCQRCLGNGYDHTLYGTDEYDMTEVMLKVEKEGRARYGHPKYHPIHSHDRLEQHVPDVKLKIEDDGSLYEFFEDIHGPDWIHARKLLGKQIAYYHFIRTKEWPKCLIK